MVISNHTTDLDPLFVGCSFPGQLYFVASSHVFRMGFASRLIRFFFALIVKVKGKSDINAVRDILSSLRRGNSVCLFAEGNRSFSGVTQPVKDSAGKLVKLSGAALITYRLRGGYFAAPRWSRKMRNGPIWGEPVGYYPAEDIKAMKAGEVSAIIRRDIYEDAYETMKNDPHPYRCKGLAEDLETALYLCPACGQIGKLSSGGEEGDVISCECGLASRYDEYGTLHCINSGGVESFTTVRDWWHWQEAAMEGLVAAAGDGIVCSDEDQLLYEIGPGSIACLAERGRLSLGKQGLCCGSRCFPLPDIAEIAITGQRTLTFSAGKKQYELQSETPRSAAKYQRIFEILTHNTQEVT
jgi:1-acyl-sn-glycerol-3-phosphate acyltransferase